jgi:hypothetical protein
MKPAPTPHAPAAAEDEPLDLDTLEPEFLAGLREAEARFEAGDPGIPAEQVHAEIQAWLAELAATPR